MNNNQQGESRVAVKDRGDMDLLELVCQLHSRALNFPSEEMHKAYFEARIELENRLKLYASNKAGFLAASTGADWKSIQNEIWKHLDSLPYAGGYPAGWEETLAKHLASCFHSSIEVNKEEEDKIDCTYCGGTGKIISLLQGI